MAFCTTPNEPLEATRTAYNFIAIAYLRICRLTHLPASPLVPALPLAAGRGIHRA